MKTTALTLLTLALAGTAAHAQIIGINSASSSSIINFDDTAAFDPSSNPGTLNISPTVSSWTGAIHSLPSTTAPVTSDVGQGDIAATFAGNSYAIIFTNVLLNQPVLNTGTVHLIFTFAVEYQLGIAGLPSQATLFPSFSVNGTVQPGGWAAVNGSINYLATTTAGTISSVETVSYNYLNLAPGPFIATVPGIPTGPGFGTTPALIANTTLTLSGTINFMVDPAELHASSFAAPEPGSALLALSGAALLGLRRRRA